MKSRKDFCEFADGWEEQEARIDGGCGSSASAKKNQVK